MSPMIRLSLTIEHALLGFLRHRPMHGYEMHQHLSNLTGLGQVWRLKQSRLYALLAKLEQQGYVITTLEQQGTRPPRKMFQLTPSGQRAFLAWVQEPVSQGRGMRMEFLAKLYFVSREEPELAMRLIERQRVACRGWLVEQQDAEAMLGTSLFGRLVHRFRFGQIEAMLAWLDECEARMPAAAS